MSCTRKLIAAIVAITLCSHAADEKKDEKKKEPPRVTAIIPFALSTGMTNKFVVRGINLTNAAALRFLSHETLTAEIKSRGKAAVPDKADAKKVGDTQLEVLLTLTANFPPGDLPFVITTPDGETGTNRLRVVERELLFNEIEPNNGFRKPNSIKIPQNIHGTIGAAADVDVFKFHGIAGQKLHIELLGAAYGSFLDAILSLYDTKGHVLVTCDDVPGSSDPSFSFSVPTDGTYFLSVMDAHDQGGLGYDYLLSVRSE